MQIFIFQKINFLNYTFMDGLLSFIATEYVNYKNKK